MADERALILALWLIHRPSSQVLLQLALRLVHALAVTPAAAWAACAQAGAVYMLTHLFPVTPTPAVHKVRHWTPSTCWTVAARHLCVESPVLAGDDGDDTGSRGNDPVAGLFKPSARASSSIAIASSAASGHGHDHSGVSLLLPLQ